MRTYLA
ncbi:Protein of unknown function [Propionibacterium freudenreichii]|nr:Protein of unknown function [Propionibacterium freudenreichii]CEH06505.1 Protein of unknown function [Propionibacterium freudenreichii]